MKTPEQIAQIIADDHDFAAVSDLRSPEQVHDMITQAIEIDRSQLYKHVLSFEPDAIRDHFEADEDDPTDGLTDDELLAVGQAALQSDQLYAAFHEALNDALEEHI